MTTFKLAISLCFLASCLLIANSQKISCNDTHPDRNQFCTKIYAPVCADYPIQCLVPPCPQVKDFGNACEACADPFIETYVNGTCPPDEAAGWGESENENGEYCEGEGEGEWNEECSLVEDGATICNNPPGVLVNCAQIYEPVCGYFYGQDEGTTYGNACLACYSGEVDYHFPGECPGDEENIEVLP